MIFHLCSKVKGVLIKNYDNSQRLIISLVYVIFCSFLLLKCDQGTSHIPYYAILGKHSPLKNNSEYMPASRKIEIKHCIFLVIV